MLVITRKVEQEVLIGDQISVMVVNVDHDKVRLGITAPKSLKILRSELTRWDDQDQQGKCPCCGSRIDKAA